MKPAEIIQLLTKYYDGNSTIEEERLLKEFFSGPCVPEELLDEQEIFRCYSSISNKDVPEPSADFEKRIISAIDREGKQQGPQRGPEGRPRCQDPQKDAGKQQRKVISKIAKDASGIPDASFYFFFTCRCQWPEWQNGKHQRWSWEQSQYR